MDQAGAVTFKGDPLTLVGNEVHVGDTAPDFTVVGEGLSAVKLSDFAGQVVVVSAVPSLDTQVCEEQTKRFNEEAAGLNAKVLTVSLDLPFAQGRFCGAFNIGNTQTVSDYKEREFGQAYGILIKELALLARAVFVIDTDGKISYREIVNEVTDHPNYDAVLAAAREVGA